MRTAYLLSAYGPWTWRTFNMQRGEKNQSVYSLLAYYIGAATWRAFITCSSAVKKKN
jgi:hypothetical protein